MVEHAPADVDVAVGFDPRAVGDIRGVIEALASLSLVPGDHLDVMDLDRAGPVARVEALIKGRSVGRAVLPGAP